MAGSRLGFGVALFLCIGPAALAQQPPARCRLKIELVDAQTGQSWPGVISLRTGRGEILRPRELLDRGLGIKDDEPIHAWRVLPEPMVIDLPQEPLKLEAFSGLHTELATIELDLRGKDMHSVKVPLVRFFDVGAASWQCANTHVHLQKVSFPESDRYLREVARCDGLDIVYVSYLERAVDDLEYTTNKYTLQDLHRLSGPHTHFDNGQEHRHNFGAYEEGYGHVMFLHLSELVRPVSLGPGITRQGTDGIPLRPGIDRACQMGSTIIWCHNAWGLEDVPNWLAGRLHANNIFDGGTHGSYQHSFYRYLNAGLKVPFSTGTDWFIYDFSRVYVPAPKRLSSEEWLAQLAAGRSFITNGPFLELTVDDARPGDTHDLAAPGAVRVRARAVGRLDFQRIELIQNGRVIRTAASQASGGHFAAALDLALPIDQPCWIAVRTPPPSSDRDPMFQTPTPKNEYGRELFSHTSAVYLTLNGKSVLLPEAVEDLLQETKQNKAFIEGKAFFASDTERRQVLGVYDEAIGWLAKRLADAQRP
jgi:hypothetical protein